MTGKWKATNGIDNIPKCIFRLISLQMTKYDFTQAYYILHKTFCDIRFLHFKVGDASVMDCNLAKIC